MPVCQVGISERTMEKLATAANQDFWCTLVLVKPPGLISQDVCEATGGAGLPSNTHHCHPSGTGHSPTPEPVSPPCWLPSTDAIPLPDRAVSCHAGTGAVPLCDATTSDISSCRQRRQISFTSHTREPFPDDISKRKPRALHSTYPSHFLSHSSKSTSAVFSWILACAREGPTISGLSSSLSALFWFL